MLDFRNARRGAVLFDLFQTLIPDRGQDARDEVSRQMGRALGVDAEAFAVLFRGTTRERMRGDLGDLGETLRTLAHRLGGAPTAAQVRFAEVTRMRFQRELLWPSAATLAVLDGLRERGHRLGLVSNCSAETVTLWPTQPLAPRFTVTGFSCELGVVKPDPTIFLKVCGDLGVAPQDCLYVGDGDSGELPAAAALGMRVVRTTRFADTDPTWTGPTVGDLAELLGWRFE
ncbi:HAD-IA family hydrolase [Catellatospora sp. KI3]|uniref:HAD family hydrolase n=1 Tax=Catellatospora sp. KI3 TaxID=3041620 RepID=UPI0024832126|nr:HAD-IA family hydrolase [Catellatospora sp. KI3]MDI1460311.1 HAD-IA family hydrolase [Catellatospora sp. KI3]